ncbi:hypothetical protein PA598K_04288 [Paenibacillus sp. 598K]|uniref:Ig-like domain-containing protein n=1 Tax=Paenibacillus sp. 598K TaxID=1117987 RepID=UPI000FF9B5DC|nr:Ig-like domain-containing protein [Paenibacillus sp. 598K]GBF75855.1 hypothetical protein PA598K_04288 [Paenibacillus sp. 598K]
MNGQFSKTMKVQARKGLLLMLCFLLLPILSLVAPGGVAQAGLPAPIEWVSVDSGVDSSLRKIIYAEDHYFTVGGDGVALRSADGAEWEPIPLFVDEDSKVNLRGLAYLENRFFVVGYDGVILTSSDGESWDAGIHDDNFDLEIDLYDIAFFDGHFYVVGDDETILQSSDGTTWTIDQGNSDGYSIRMIAANEDRIVTIGENGQLLYKDSGDAAEWTSGQSFSGDMDAVAYHGGLFVAVGESGKLLTSTDGITWAVRSSGTTETLRGVEWIEDSWYVVGSDGTALRSSDGLIWDALPAAESTRLYDIASGDGGIFAVGQNGKIYRYGAFQVIPENWVPVTLTNMNNDLHKITYENDRYIAVGAGGALVSSVDGETWTTTNIQGVSGLWAILYHGDKYYAAGENGAIIHSTNLSQWSGVQPEEWLTGDDSDPDAPSLPGAPTEALYDSVKAGEGFMLVGENQSMVVYDEMWMNITESGGTAVLRGIDATETMQVAVGEDRTLLYLALPDDGDKDDAGSNAPDPVWQTWTPVTEGPPSYDLFSVAAHEDKYVAVGSHGVILTSSNGKDWTMNDEVTSSNLRSVRWIDDRFYAVGDGGLLISSETGETWKKHAIEDAPSFDFYDIVKGPAGMVIVGAGGEAIRQVVVRVASVELSKNELTFVENGEPQTLTATVLPADALNQEIAWSSSDETVATVVDGVVTPHAIGEATITVTTVDGGFTDTADIKVKSSWIDVEGVTLDRETLSLNENASETLTATVTPSDASDQELTWISSDPAIATVVGAPDGTATVTAVKHGSATITVKTVDGEFTDTVEVTVHRPATGITVSPTTQKLAVGGQSVPLVATVTPTGATNATVTWTSSDPAVAQVSNTGVVTPVAQGTATITATVGGTLTATSTITVEQLVSGINLVPSELTLDELASGTITATVLPANASDASVTWTTSNSAVATVNEQGQVTAVSKGTATITATSADGERKAQATVTVIRRAASVTVAPDTLSLYEHGAAATLTATVSPQGANNSNVAWTSSDTTVATVNANGVVTPKAIGEAKITATTADGGHTSFSTVTVQANRANHVELDKYEIRMDQGDQPVKLTATVYPSNASDKRVTWSTDNPAVATVSDGWVTAVGGGSTDITVRTVDGGYTRQARVIVKQTVWPVTGVTLDYSTLDLTVGGATGLLKATVAPAEASNKAVQWSSSKPGVATVNANGVVTPVAVGTTQVTVTTVDGSRTASATVTVKAATPPVTPGNGNGGGGGGGVIAAPPATKEEVIAGVVDGGAASAQGLSSFTIKRVTGDGGAKQDTITLEAAKTKDAADKAKAAGLTAIRLIVPDSKDEVSQTKITLPLGALSNLQASDLGLELNTVNARLVIGSESLAELKQELIFQLKPLKTASEQAQVETRAAGQSIVRDAVGAGSFEVVGRPVTIETNMTGQPVQIILPLAANLVPQDAAAREAWLARLMIFIEHSDGERALVRPQVVTEPSGQLGLAFQVTKFSTFSILDIEPSDAETPETPEAEGSQGAYVSGYEDGTFRPSNQVTRAELASILARLYAAEPAASADVELSDIDTHWAATAIRTAVAGGYMQGYPDGTFQPNRVLTRAEIAAILARIQGLTHSGVATFGDVASGHWAEGYIAAVQQAGLMTGYEGGQFRPGQGVTRAEVVVIFNRLLERGPLTGVTEPSWSDVGPGHWAFGDIESASRTQQ